MIFLKLIIISILTTTGFAQELTTKLIATGVNQTNTNSVASGTSRGYYSCNEFKGTYAGNTVILKPIASGGSGRYSHRIVLTLGEGYKVSHGTRTQIDYYVYPGNVYYLYLPELREDTDFIQQSAMVITKDLKTNKTVSSTILFNVTRPVLLKKSKRESAVAKDCFEIYPGYQSPIGVLSNSSTNPSQLQIKQGVQKLWSSMSGSQWGFFFSPLAWTQIGNVFMINRNYFTQYSKQVIETVEVSSGYQLSPGDYVQIYEQRTRYVSAFDAYLIDVCGEAELIEEEYMLQWWGLAYHAVPISAFASELPPIETIGAYPRNTCPAEYSPDFSNPSDFRFIRTN